MTFTDDDLKRLKNGRYFDMDKEVLPNDKLESLLARLEAAEKVCELLNGPVHESFWQVMTEWRKAAGK